MLTRPATSPGRVPSGWPRAGPAAPARGAPPDAKVRPDRGYAATAALLAVTLVSAAGFDRVFSGHGWIGPVLACAVGVHMVCWYARRAQWHPLTALLVATAAVVALTIWTVVPGTTTAGLPLGATWHAVRMALDDAHRQFEASLAPAPLTTGFDLLAVWAVGLVALVADWAAFRARSAFQAVMPGLALFVLCSVLGTPVGRPWAVATEVAAVAAFVAVHGAVVGRRALPWFAGRRRGASGWAAGLGAATAMVAVVASLLVMPILPAREGQGPFGWRSGASSGAVRIVRNPIVDLHTRQLQESNTPVFTVHSSQPSYWRLTSLDTFTGQQWVSTDSYDGVHTRLPGTRVIPKGVRQVNEGFTIQQLDSVWLPSAFNPIAVHGAGPVSYDPISGSLLSDHATSNGLTYSVTSLEYLDTVDAAALQAAAPLGSTPGLGAYLQLPGNIPAAVRTLAEQVTAGQSTEYGKALALQQFFQGPAFTFSLTPPNDGYGTQSLTNFLFRTREGYCQQFAGSYVVMARLLGLPTRLVYGFTTGTPTAAGTWQVTDADAHTWPEMYFPSFGWIPFEPTKGSANPATNSYLPPPAAPGGATGITTVPSTVVTTPPNLNEHHQLSKPAPSTPVPGPARGSSGSWPLLLLGGLAVLIGAAGLWILLNVAARRVRWKMRRSRLEEAGRSTGVPEAAWREIGEYLAWWDVRRAADETFAEFALRAERQLALVLRRDDDARGLGRLADAASEALYAPPNDGPSGDDAVDGGGLDLQAAELRNSLWAAAPWSRRLVWWTHPGLTWRDPARLPTSPRADHVHGDGAVGVSRLVTRR
ncbi:MAG: transglutaminase family protein [Acidimicrobiales bacterium]